MLAGNAVVVKHSPRTPLCGEHFARAFAEAGGPEGAVQALFVDYETTEKIVGDSRVDRVLFTGSVLGGHRIQAAAKDRFLHVGLELGGNDPAYVAADARPREHRREHRRRRHLQRRAELLRRRARLRASLRSTTSSSPPPSRS